MNEARTRSHRVTNALHTLVLLAGMGLLLLQLALSRTRELDADLGAFEMTGDAVGLASALEKMERYKRGLWDLIVIPGRRLPDPSILRTHPNTEARIRRLLELAELPVKRPPREPVPWAERPSSCRERSRPWSDVPAGT